MLGVEIVALLAGYLLIGALGLLLGIISVARDEAKGIRETICWLIQNGNVWK